MNQTPQMTSGEACPLCEKNANFNKRDSHFDVRVSQNYQLYECSFCQGQFWLPLKNPGSNWYEHDPRYAHRNIDPHIKPNWNHRKVISFLKSKTRCTSAKNHRRVLDVGCGTGNFLTHASKNGWDVHGIDFDRDAIGAAQTILGLQNVEVETLAGYRARYPEQKFDLITFFDLFEHIDNHNEFAGTVYEMLNPGGYIAMSMPYRGGARWLRPHDYPPRHLTYWARHPLIQFWQRHGFTIRYIRRRSEGLRFLILKLRFKYGRHTSFNLVSKIKAKNVFGGMIKTDQKTQKKIGVIQGLAQVKDFLIFGIPAFFIWLIMLPSAKRYITLYMIAQKNE